jgi:hypothetical protein
VDKEKAGIGNSSHHEEKTLSIGMLSIGCAIVPGDGEDDPDSCSGPGRMLSLQ